MSLNPNSNNNNNNKNSSNSNNAAQQDNDGRGGLNRTQDGTSNVSRRSGHGRRVHPVSSNVYRLDSQENLNFATTRQGRLGNHVARLPINLPSNKRNGSSIRTAVMPIFPLDRSRITNHHPSLKMSLTTCGALEMAKQLTSNDYC